MEAKILQNENPKKDIRVSRKEMKYMVDLEDRLYLISALNKILIPDVYGDYNGYSVRTLYLDGVDNQDYMSKKNKQDFRKRMRIRIYKPTDELAKFEIKRKFHGRQVKDSVLIKKEDVIEIQKGNFEPLLNYDSPTARMGYELGHSMGYRPVSVVEYKRRAYTHPSFNTRVTLDNMLRYKSIVNDLYAEDINFNYAMPLRNTILEVKFESYLFESIQKVLANCNLQKCKISKFGSSRALLEEYYG